MALPSLSPPHMHIFLLSTSALGTLDFLRTPTGKGFSWWVHHEICLDQIYKRQNKHWYFLCVPVYIHLRQIEANPVFKKYIQFNFSLILPSPLLSLPLTFHCQQLLCVYVRTGDSFEWEELASALGCQSLSGNNSHVQALVKMRFS